MRRLSLRAITHFVCAQIHSLIDRASAHRVVFARSRLARWRAACETGGMTSTAAAIRRAGARSAFGIRIHVTVVDDALVLLPDRSPALITHDERVCHARRPFIGACLRILSSALDQ